jgi:HSP20 family protein
MRWVIKRQFTPPYDIAEADDKIIIMVEVAGMKAEDFNISLLNEALIINGVRHRPDFSPLSHHRVEIGFGEFRLYIPIPWSIEDDVVATYHEGFLTIELPRTQQRRINVVERMTISPSEEDSDAHDE